MCKFKSNAYLYEITMWQTTSNMNNVNINVSVINGNNMVKTGPRTGQRNKDMLSKIEPKVFT